MDCKGVHPSSSMAGGDTVLRHNHVRNLIYKYSCRGRLNAELEKAGVLGEPRVFVELARPVDVMIDDDRSASQGPERIAIDVKVINALCPTTTGRH